MPSKPKGRSEYKANFKWLESFRGKGFKPSPEQLAPAAGQGSVFSKTSEEPAIQHKKRVEGPPTSLSVNFDDGKYQAYDDFALLGKQQKFASNVPYGLRPSKVSKMADKAKDMNNNFSSSIPPPRKQMKMEEKQVRKKQDTSEAKSKKVSSKENLTPTSPPPAPRQSKSSDQFPEKEGLKDKNLSDILPKSKKQAKDNMNESVQTNMDKGIAQSSQEAPADYSLKYKAGIAPARVNRKASEYQKEYSWKKGIPASPLLSAEQIVYNNNSQVSPPKKAVLAKRTEYQSQFKTYKFPEAAPPAPKPSDDLPSKRRSRTLMKRSRSVGAAASPDRMAPAGSAPVTSADDPRLLRESRNSSPIPKVPISHGQLRHVASEYESNFKSPTKFSYEGGAWKDAYPPQLLQGKSDNGEKKEEAKVEEEAPLANWFAEVLELRRRANEYKRRAQGTHFSREHLLQLLAQQTGYWDTDSARSSAAASLDALALEPAKPAAGLPSFSKSKAAQAKMSVDKASMMAVRGDSPEPADNNSLVAVDKKSSKKGRGGRKSKTAWQEEKTVESEQTTEPDQPLDTNQNAACEVQSTEGIDEMEMEEVEEQGRLPTPVLRQQQQKAQRHHLDRTTPSVGGILLSVPSQEQYSARSDLNEEAVSEASQPSQKLKTRFTTEKLQTSPLLGKPTPDTHALRDDSIDHDEVLNTKYIASPQVALAKSDRNVKALQQKINNRIPATIDERMGQTYNKDVGNFHVEDLPLVSNGEKEDDVLSLSAMSIASSSSLASEVYERARRRRDQFWGKPAQ